MPISYPGALDSLSNPGATTKRNDPGFELHTVVSTLNDIAEAVEAKVGVGATTPTVGKILVGGATAGASQWDDPHFTNSLLNGGQELWPRGTSVAVAASVSTTAGYGPHRWCLKTGANQASVISQATGLTDGSQFASKVLRNSGQTGTGVMVYEQAYILEEIVKLRGQKVSLSFAIKAGANWSPTSGNITVRVACGTGAAARRGGSAYTSETTLISQTFAITTTPGVVPNVSSVVVPTGATQLSVSFEWTPVGTAGADDSFTVDDVMLVSGDVPMAYRGRSDDRYECSTYWRELSGTNTEFLGAGFASSTTAGSILVQFGGRMRTTPSTPTFSAASDFQVLNKTTLIALTNLSFSNVGPSSALATITVASGLTADQGLLFGASSGNARIKVDAEL